MKPIEAYVDQAKVTILTGNLTQINRTKVATMALATIGNRQYPITHTDWKKLTAPPNSLAFNVTTAAPNQTITNTLVKMDTA